MVNTGKDYEQFVAIMQQALLNSDAYSTQKNIEVEVNKVIVDNCGIERQFDIYWEYELGGITYKTVIECKDYNSNISVEKIDAIIGKISDIPDLKPIFATKKGYQSGTKTKAEKNKIDLLIVREQNDSDWVAEDGTPLIQKISINICMLIPARIHKFVPIIDPQWVKDNTSIDIDQPISLEGLDDEIFIEDLSLDSTYSIHDIASTLSPLNGEEYGAFKKEETFDDAFICNTNKGVRLKLVGYKIEYSTFKPATNVIEADFSKEIIGVIEYLQKGTKKTIFRDGKIR